MPWVATFTEFAAFIQAIAAALFMAFAFAGIRVAFDV